MVHNTCACCYKQSSDIVLRRSALVAAQRVATCPDCRGHELRSIVVLCGRTNGLNYIQKQLLDKLYCGPEVLARDLV